MSYISDMKKMNDDARKHRDGVWLSVKITFIALGVALILFLVTLLISLLLGGIGKKDTEPPVVIPAKSSRVVGYIGNIPIYKKMIIVEDNVDSLDDIIIKIDNKEVDINKEGEYKVYYTVMDTSGNTTEFTIIYIVKRNDYKYEDLEELIGQKAAELGITKTMSDTQKVKKIYEYVNSKSTIAFNDESNIPNINRANWEVDWIEEAIRVLDTREGDCYSYYSLSKAFFEYFGIDNIGIKRAERSDEPGTHFWSVVKVESGWYYYDSTRLAGEFEDKTRNACLITEAKLKGYRTSDGGEEFYLMDKPSGFPKIATKEVD